MSICVGVLIVVMRLFRCFFGLFLFGLLKVFFPYKLVSVDGAIYFLVFVSLEII